MIKAVYMYKNKIYTENYVAILPFDFCNVKTR